MSAQLLYDREGPKWTGPLRTEEELAVFAAPLSRLAREEFWLILLNKKYHPTAIFRTQGARSMTIVPSLECCAAAVLGKAHAVIALHNHPSGESTPSTQDYSSMRHLRAVIELLDIQFASAFVLGGTQATRFNGAKAKPVPFVDLQLAQAPGTVVQGPHDVPRGREGVLALGGGNRILGLVPLGDLRALVAMLPSAVIAVTTRSTESLQSACKTLDIKYLDTVAP